MGDEEICGLAKCHTKISSFGLRQSHRGYTPVQDMSDPDEEEAQRLHVEDGDAEDAEGYEQLPPQGDIFSRIRSCLRIFTILSAGAVCVSLVATINIISDYDNLTLGRKYLCGLLSGYDFVMAICIIFIELDCSCVRKVIPLAGWWTLRGISQTFVAVLAVHLAEFIDDDRAGLQAFQVGASIALAFCGLLYLLMGCCGGSYKEKASILADIENQRMIELEEVNKKYNKKIGL